MRYREGPPIWLLVPAFLPICLGGFGVPLFQTLGWFATGEWYALPLWRALEWLGMDWVSLAEVPGWAGVSKILFWVMDLPTALCLVVTGVLWFMVLCWGWGRFTHLRRTRARQRLSGHLWH